MPDKQPAMPRSTLELLDSVPESLLRRLKQYSGRFSTEAVTVMQDRLPFFAELEASQRASLALVVQTAVANFVEWMTDPHSNVNYTARAFELMPQDLTRRIALRHSVDMLRVTMEFFEEVGPLLARSDEQLTALTSKPSPVTRSAVSPAPSLTRSHSRGVHRPTLSSSIYGWPTAGSGRKSQPNCPPPAGPVSCMSPATCRRSR